MRNLDSKPEIDARAPVGACAGRSPIVIALPLPPKECSPNWSGKLRDRIRAKREAREWAYHATIAVLAAMRTPWWDTVACRVRATAAFTFPVRRTRDDDNLTSSLKAYRDGIATALCGDDSGWTWDGPPTVTIGPDEGVTITVWQILESEG